MKIEKELRSEIRRYLRQPNSNKILKCFLERYKYSYTKVLNVIWEEEYFCWLKEQDTKIPVYISEISIIKDTKLYKLGVEVILLVEEAIENQKVNGGYKYTAYKYSRINMNKRQATFEIKGWELKGLFYI